MGRGGGIGWGGAGRVLDIGAAAWVIAASDRAWVLWMLGPLLGFTGSGPSYPLREVWLLLLSRLIVRPARDLKVVNVYFRGEGRLGRWTLVSVDDGVARGRVKNVVAWMCGEYGAIYSVDGMACVTH